FSPDTVDDDVAALRRYYQDHGFFDVRIGRKLIVSPDQREMMVQFLIEEGPRYVIEKISFEGNQKVSEAELRQKLKLVEGRPYDANALQRDVRQVVRAY